MTVNKNRYIKSSSKFSLLHHKLNLSCLNDYKIKQKIATDPDFIWSKKYQFSLKNALKKDKLQLTDKTIAQYLRLTLEEFECIYNNVIEKLKSYLSDYK